jgi:hypothetical protein
MLTDRSGCRGVVEKFYDERKGYAREMGKEGSNGGELNFSPF